MFGTELSSEQTPCLISTVATDGMWNWVCSCLQFSYILLLIGKSLLNVAVDINPIDSKFDQRIRMSLLPVKVVYDAETINNLLDMFIPPSPVKLQTMSTNVSATLASLRTQTRAGLEHAISERKMMDIDILLNSPIINIPEKGVLSDGNNVLIINLGSLAIRSDMKHHVPDVRVSLMVRLWSM